MATDITLFNYEIYATPDWDGCGARPITAETLALARAIAKLMSQPADIAPGGDGSVGFEWCDFETDHKVFMDINDGGINIYVRIGTKILQSRK